MEEARLTVLANDGAKNAPGEEGKKSLLILVLKSSFEHLLSRVSRLNLANAQARGGCVLNAQCSKECLSCRS